MEIQRIQILSQLVDNMSIAEEKLEESFEKNDSETFNKAKKEINDIHNKLSQILK